MKYPTQAEIEKASHVQLGTWVRYLPPPGQGAIGQRDVFKVMKEEQRLQALILMRFGDCGGWTPEVSKDVGWTREEGE